MKAAFLFLTVVLGVLLMSDNCSGRKYLSRKKQGHTVHRSEEIEEYRKRKEPWDRDRSGIRRTPICL